MDIDPNELLVTNNDEQHRYEVECEGQLSELAYSLRGDTLRLIHTGVPKALAGRGIAARLAQFALDDARARGLRVDPRCAYVRAFLEKNPEYQDLVS